ncbi:MAG TPA: phytoene desaturase, partial [Candidatus Kapabacteria bacterium]|nr:phytoene desaturase [Candidatus Kapabacteria bacterium]
FHDTIDIVIKSNFDSYLQYFRNLMKVNPSHLPVLLRSFYNQVSRYFDSDVVKQIISLVAFFLGRTPFDTMGIYTLLSYTEFKHDGYHNVVGGMYKIVEGLLEELKKHNVNIHYNTEIVDFQANGSKLFTFIDNEGNNWSADIFLINSDAAYFRGKVLKRDEFSQSKLDKMQWTMGYLTIYLGLNIKLNNVAHHNYFLGENYTDYAKNVYRNPDTLEKPYYYVNVISKHNSELAPDGCESVFIVCPVPDLRYKSNWDDAEVIVNSIVQDFSKRIGININEHIVAKRFFTPIDWQNKFNLYRGSGLGLAHNMWQIGAFRPKNFDEVFENVFYAGASTHPGAGLPMGIISSKLAFERIMQYCHK